MKLVYSAVCIVFALSSCKSKDDKSSSEEVPKPVASETGESDPPKVEPEKGEAAEAADPEVAKRCEVAIAKVSLDALMADKPKPKPEEQAIIDLARAGATESCIKEGLSLEQAACFDAISDVDSLLAIRECPAIAEKSPGWLRSYAPPKSE